MSITEEHLKESETFSAYRLGTPNSRSAPAAGVIEPDIRSNMPVRSPGDSYSAVVIAPEQSGSFESPATPACSHTKSPCIG